MFKPETRFLIIENQRTLIGLVKKMLRELGFSDFIECRDGRSGWMALENSAQSTSPIDVVICGWFIPHITAIDLLKMARMDQRFKALPFLFMTPHSEQSKVEEALRWQVTHYILSPFTTEQMREKLEESYVRSMKKAPG